MTDLNFGLYYPLYERTIDTNIDAMATEMAKQSQNCRSKSKWCKYQYGTEEPPSHKIAKTSLRLAVSNSLFRSQIGFSGRRFDE